jgi:hypothetical protein
MRRVAIWISRLFGLFVFIYGINDLYQAWWWGHFGLHQRVYDREAPGIIELNAVHYILMYTRQAPAAILLIVSGMTILGLSFRRA